MKLKATWLLLAPVSIRPLARTPSIYMCTFAFLSSDSRNGCRFASSKSPSKSSSIGTAQDCWSGRCNERHTPEKCPFLPRLWQTQFFAGQFPRGCLQAPQKKHCCVFVARHSGWLTDVCWSEPVRLTAREWLAEIATDDEVYNCAFLCASSSERALSNATWSSVTLSSKSLWRM